MNILALVIDRIKESLF